MADKLTWAEVRKRTGLSSAEMASHLGMSRQLYSMKERYIRPMRVEEATEIVRLARIDIQKVRLK